MCVGVVGWSSTHRMSLVAMMCSRILVLATVLFFFVISSSESKVILLDDDNFESLTQASTGMTTGKS
jgi:hypothetical protein